MFARFLFAMNWRATTGRPYGLCVIIGLRFFVLQKIVMVRIPLTIHKKISVQCLQHHTVILWRRARDFFGVLPYAFASLRSLTTDFQTVHRTVFIGKADRPCSNPLLSYQQKIKGTANAIPFIFWRRARDSNPRNRFGGLHDFQSCSFDQLGQLSVLPVILYTIV